MPDKQIEDSLKNIIEGIGKVQEICDRNEKRIQTMEEEQIAKISEDVTKSMDTISNMEAKSKKFDEAIISLEKKISRPGNAKEEACSVGKSDYLKYLRRGIDLSIDVQKSVAYEIATKQLLGASEQEISNYTKTLVEGRNPDGGYWLRPELANFVIDRVFETSNIRQIASVMTISGESLEIIVDDNEAEGEWVGEVDTRNETNTPQIGLNKIFAHELSAKPKISQRMLDDAGFDVESWLGNKVADIFMRMENTSFVIGDGAKKPRGFLDYPAWTVLETYQRNALEQIDSGSAGTFDGDNLIDQQNLLLEPYQPNAVWVMNRKTWPTVMKAKNSQGDYLLNPLILAQGAAKILLGNPVLFFSDMPVEATNSLSVAYGDFRKGYTILDRIGIRILRDPFTIKPFVLFYTTKRVGGDVTNYDSIKILKLAA